MSAMCNCRGGPTCCMIIQYQQPVTAREVNRNFDFLFSLVNEPIYTRIFELEEEVREQRLLIEAYRTRDSDDQANCCKE
jgi:hypothetical protein